ncbi:MAG: stage V sporulation protein G [Candidatus Omnitrophota bacterium]|nr:MAG: stage V sporulation protein G [Candidatus Omnitrophota bacterium]
MEITEVRIFLRNKETNKKLKAYVTVTFDNCFVVRDIKIIDGAKGLFVAMPSAKMKNMCSKCGHRNVIRSKFCNQCGTALQQHYRHESERDDTRQTEHKDIAHPITSDYRDYLQKKVLEVYKNETDVAAQVVDDSQQENDLPNNIQQSEYVVDHDDVNGMM